MTTHPPFSSTIPMSDQQAALVVELTRKLQRLKARKADPEKIEQLREVIRYHLLRM